MRHLWLALFFALNACSAAEKSKAEVSAWYEKLRNVRVAVSAPKDHVGKKVRAEDGSGGTASGALAEKDGFARVTLSLPKIEKSKTAGKVKVFLEDKQIFEQEMDDLNALRRDAFLSSDVRFKKYVFSGNAFPERLDFGAPGIEIDIPNKVETQFFNSQGQAVNEPSAPGAYAAISRVTIEDTKVLTRQATLFRLQDGEKLPDKWPGADPFFWKMVNEWGLFPDAPARMLAGAELTTGARGPLGQAISKNQKWWFELLKQIGSEKLQYDFALPEGYDADKNSRWPLLLVLHGSGESGDELKRVRWHGPLKIIDAGRKLPFVVIAPQCPAHSWWNPFQLNALLDEVCAKYRIDPDREYVTGLSMGGFGAWHLAAEFPERFAAVAPICGKSDPADAPRLKDLPIWIFHGRLDETVHVAFSEEMTRALAAEHARVKFTLLAQEGHQSWTPAYNDAALYDWLLKQKRGAPEQPRAETPDAATSIVNTKR